jgi:hypothetical protein
MGLSLQWKSHRASRAAADLEKRSTGIGGVRDPEEKIFSNKGGR